MFIPYKSILKDIVSLEQGISECLINQAKIPTFVRACQEEIDRAEVEEEGEKKDNIIKIHKAQIDEHNHNVESNIVMIENLYEIRQRLIDTYFP